MRVAPRRLRASVLLDPDFPIQGQSNLLNTEPLDAVRDAVRREWSNAHRLEAEQKLYSSLRERYEIVVEQPPSPSAHAEASR